MQYLLAALVFFGVLTAWVTDYWAVAAFEVGACILATVAMLRGIRTPRFTFALVPLFFAVFWGFFQYWTGRTVSPFNTRIALARWTSMLAIFVVGYILFQDLEVHSRFRKAIVWFGFLLAALSTLQAFTSHGKVFWIFPAEVNRNVLGPFVSRNQFAAFIEVVLPLAMYGSLRHRREALLYSCMTGVMYAAVIASGSRAGLLLTSAEIIAVVLFLWLYGKTSGSALGWSLLRILILLTVFTVAVGWGRVWSRLQSSDPYEIRRELAISSISMIKARPVYGFGMGTWPIVYPQYAIIDVGQFANRAHNDWLEWTADGGLPFGVAMLSLFLWCLPKACRTIWGIGVVAVFLHATVDYPFSRPALAGWIIVMIALIAAAPDKRARGVEGDN